MGFYGVLADIGPAVNPRIGGKIFFSTSPLRICQHRFFTDICYPV
jgi:hypothetical protein